MMISSSFKSNVAANVRYWQKRTADISDLMLSMLDHERQNLYLAVDYGLKVPETALATAELVAQLFELPERRGYWTEWLPILQRAISACDEDNDEQMLLKIKLLNQLGFLQRLNRDLDTAIKTHLQVVNKTQDYVSHELTKAYFFLGNAYYDSRQYEQARHYGEKTLQAAATTGKELDTERKAAVLNLLGLIAHARGNYEKAKQLYQQSVVAWEQSDEFTYLARTWNNLGLSHLELDEYESALDCFAKAGSILETTASELDKVKAEMFRGLVFFERQDWLQAEEAFQKANTPFLRQSEDLYHQALLMNNLGNVYLMQGAYAKAASHLNKGISLWRSQEDEMMMGNSLGALAEVQAKRNQIELALITYADAIQLLDNFPDNAWARKRCLELQEQYNNLKKQGDLQE